MGRVILRPLTRFLRKIPGKGFLLLIGLIWVIGGVSKWRWLSPRTCLILSLLIIAVWVIYALIKWFINRRKEKEAEKPSDLAIEFEERLMDAIKMAGSSLWYMVVGPSGCGKTSVIRNSDLEFSHIYSSQEKPIKEGIKETKNCDLFLTKEEIIFDTAGRYVTYGSDARVNKEWRELLYLLRKHRKSKQIEGLLVAIDIASLLQGDDDFVQSRARTIRRCIEDVVSEFRITLPVYLVFTKCDLIHGFEQFFADLSGSERMQVWGATLKISQQENADVVFKRECEKLFQFLNARRLFKLTSAQEQERRSIYTFPLQFDAVHQKLDRFVAALFPNVSEEGPILRGFYFTGVVTGTAKADEQPPIEFVMRRVAGSFDHQPALISEQPAGDKRELKGYFIRDIFSKIIFPDRTLSRPTNSSDRRKTFMRLVFCAAAVFLVTVLTSALAFSYVHNKRLMAEVQQQVSPVSEITDNTPVLEKHERFERLRKPIVRLEGFSLFGLLWQDQRDEVAEAGRSLYLLKKYGDDTGYKFKFKRKIEIPVHVFRSNPEKDTSDPDKYVKIPKVNIKADVMGKQYSLRTDGEGLAALNTKIEDGKVSIVFSTDYKEGEYELVEKNPKYEVQPGETKSKDGVRFIYSKLKRIIEVRCIDQFGENLAGVPVSIFDDKSNKLDAKDSNEEGLARLELESPGGANLLIRYGDSPTNYEAEPDTVAVQAGQTEYPPITKTVVRKIQISVKAFTGDQPKSGFSFSIDGESLGPTDFKGEWSGISRNIPTTQNIKAGEGIEVDVKNNDGVYSIVLKCGSTAPIPPKPVPGPYPPTTSQYLKAISESQRPIRDVEVWRYVQGGERSPSGSGDEMSFVSGGKQFRLVRLNSTTNSEGKILIPNEVPEGSQLLLCHPEYWSLKDEWRKSGSGVETFEMVSIKKERSIQEFDQSQIDGANYYYKKAREEHKNRRRSEAIVLYNKAIKLLPKKAHYAGLGWAYYEIEKKQEAQSEVKKGLELNLRGDQLQMESQKELEGLAKRLGIQR